jgi:phospholipid-binding lipoprotein MlaA
MVMRYTHPLALAGVLLLGGCASNGDPRDPLEPMNRALYSFNEGLDKATLKPLATGYRAAMPTPVQSGVRNFFSNLDDVTVLINDVLQLKVQQGVSDLMRLAFNTTFGFFGFADVASEMGLKKHNEDFGQSLGRWGVGSGAYLVLPFFGSSSLRDGLGMAVDSHHTDMVMELDHIPSRNWTVLTRVVSKRADLLDATAAVEAAALDGYEFTRDFYLERREGLVNDGATHRADI